MSNVINYQFSPVPLDLKTAMRRIFKGNQYKVIDAIADETYLYPDTRLTLTKELASRYLANKTGIAQPHVVAALNKLEKKDCISMVKSHVKGEGSIISLRINVILSLSESDTKNVSNKSKTKNVSDFKQSDTENVSNQAKLDTDSVSNQKSISKKDHQESDQTDSTINIDQKGEKQPERNNIKTPFNCSSLVKDRLINSKKSNSYKPAVNLLCPASETGNSDFSTLGSVLANVIPNNTPTFPEKSSSTPITVISIPVINKGKEILQSKGFNASNIQAITERIINGIKKNSPEKPVPYFIAACNNEKIKTTSKFVTSSIGTHIPSLVRPVIAQGAAAPQVKIKKQEEIKQEIPEVILSRIQISKPDEMWQVISDVNNDAKVQKSLTFFESDEMKKHVLINHYITEFKKRYPELPLT